FANVGDARHGHSRREGESAVLERGGAVVLHFLHQLPVGAEVTAGEEGHGFGSRRRFGGGGESGPQAPGRSQAGRPCGASFHASKGGRENGTCQVEVASAARAAAAISSTPVAASEPEGWRHTVTAGPAGAHTAGS